MPPHSPETLAKGGKRKHDRWLAEVPKVVRYTISCAIANVLYFGLYTVLLGFIASAGLCVNLAYLASVGMCVRMFVCVYVCVCVCSHVCVIVCVFVSVFVYKHVCVHTYTYTHIHMYMCV